ncbi:MAG: dihydroneopterin aldolase [Bacteroidales bacterium]|jgi:7,8-dihydroneopterin aldolase/epimerase/oxygenase|nr:dihydroneopterin aldolase [Bacteroidales bacterium]MDD3160822.1 dihydroneopterin aldolase [Bacteroidales bacterium]
MNSNIFLKGMEFYAFHGVSPQEREVGNTFLVDVTIECDLFKASLSDDLHDTINYATVFEIVKEEMEIPSLLLEHVGGRIIRAILQQFEQATNVKVKVSKVNPPIGGQVEKIGITLSASRC